MAAVGPIAFVLVFLALPLGTALFLAGYTLATLAWRGLDGAPLAVWALIAVALGALGGLVIGRSVNRRASPPW